MKSIYLNVNGELFSKNDIKCNIYLGFKGDGIPLLGEALPLGKIVEVI